MNDWQIINNTRIMKTKEYFEKMTKEELVSHAMQMEQDNEFWCKAARKAEKKLEAVKGMVCSMMAFMD